MKLTAKFQFSEQMIPQKHLHVVLIYLAVINVVTYRSLVRNESLAS